MDNVDQLTAALSQLSTLVDHLWYRQLELPMPGGGDVHQALDRMMVMGATYTHWLKGHDAPAIDPPVVYGWVPAAEFREAMDGLAAAAAALDTSDGVLTTPIGSIRADELISMVLVGVVMNGQCLAAATGSDFAVPPEVLAQVDPFTATPARRPSMSH